MTYLSMSAMLHLEILKVECFQPLLDISAELCISSSSFSSPFLSKYLTEHVTGQFILCILVATCWIEALDFLQFLACS